MNPHYIRWGEEEEAAAAAGGKKEGCQKGQAIGCQPWSLVQCHLHPY
jgi:hypothetical protein